MFSRQPCLALGRVPHRVILWCCCFQCSVPLFLRVSEPVTMVLFLSVPSGSYWAEADGVKTDILSFMSEPWLTAQLTQYKYSRMCAAGLNWLRACIAHSGADVMAQWLCIRRGDWKWAQRPPVSPKERLCATKMADWLVNPAKWVVFASFLFLLLLNRFSQWVAASPKLGSWTTFPRSVCAAGVMDRQSCVQSQTVSTLQLF